MNAERLNAEIARLQQMCNAARFEAVERQTRPLIQHYPDDPRLQFVRATALGYCGQREQARALLASAIQLQPNVPAYYQMLAQFNVMDERFGEAHNAYDEALRRWPGQPATVALKADLFVTQHRHEEADDLLQPLLESPPVDPGVARTCGRLALATGDGGHAIDVLKQSLEGRDIPPQMRSHCLFLLGALLDRDERYDEAIDVIHQANALRAGRYDVEGHRAEVDRIISAWGDANVSELPVLKPQTDGPRPVFIIGVLRSGSSLLEQILDAHSSVTGMGEWPVAQEAIRRVICDGNLRSPASLPAMLTAQRLSMFRTQVLDAAEQRAGGSPFFTDKHLGNVHWVGLLSRAFPDSRFLICRRDHADTCISAYFQDLTNYNALRLESMAHYCLTIERLTNHWKAVLGDSALEVHYEDMARDQESTTRRILEFLELPWDPECLRFHESRRVTVTVSNQQVNRPMYVSSIGRSRHYEKHLAGVRRILASAAT